MKQVLQNLRSGKVEVADVPAPGVRPAHLLIRTAATLISPGTERMLVEFGQSGLLGKARAQPEKVRQLVTKIRTDGVKPALEAVASRLEEPLPLGYSNVGRVLEVGAGVTGFVPGQRVLSNGPHAGIVCVPATLAAPIPDEVDDASAAFGVLGAIALNGVRLLEPTLGESFAVVGLGVLGLLGVQLLRAHGCRVLAIDVDAERCALARTLGADVVCVARDADPVRAAHAESRGRGLDGALITATAKGNAVVQQAAHMCRKRGRIVLVGVVGLELERAAFYEKELSFRVACSYGPGRYDPAYEAQGHDYPLGFVRWTAARNFAAVLDATARGALDVRPLLSRRVAVGDAEQAYDAILADRSALGVLLEYPAVADPLLARESRVTTLAAPSRPGSSDARSEAAASLAPRVGRGAPRTAKDAPVVGVIGAGQFARLVLLPALQAAGARIATVASAGGVTSLHAARRFGAAEATTDVAHVLASPDVDAVLIATRHDSHADLVVRALEAGKHVFVEKPLAIDAAGLERVAEAHARAGDRIVMVGFNRRFAPCAVQAKRLLAARSGPITIDMMVNAGELSAEHWTRDPHVGGGRIVGEGCHFVDLALFLAGAPIVGARATGVTARPGALPSDDATLCLELADGSLATIAYRTSGPKSFPKERVEIFCEGRALVIDNWRALHGYDWPGVKRARPWAGQDKGHRAEVAAFLEAVRSGADAPIPFADLVSVTETALALARQLAGDDRVLAAAGADDAQEDAAVLHEAYTPGGVAHAVAGEPDWPSAAGEGAS